MKISVLINTYNRKAALDKTLAALAAQAYPKPEIEILVLDDCGTDGTYEALNARAAEFSALGFGAFRTFRNAQNMGIAHGRDLLTKAADPGSEALLYLDDDVYVEKDTIGALAGRLAGDARCGVVGPRLVYAADPGKTAHCANFVGKWSGRYSEIDAAAETDCDWLNSSCFLVRRGAAARAHYAAGFYTAHEEVDFCLQLKNAGFAIIYFPLVRAVHDLPVKGGGRRDRLYYLYRNKFLVFRRNFPPVRIFAACLTGLLLGLPRYLLDSVLYNRGINRREIRLIFKAVTDGLAGREGKISITGA
jgi:GT2 family glycosyltransferase